MTSARFRERPSFLRQVWLVLEKDLRIEARGAEVTATSGFFALLVVVLSSMSFYSGPTTSRSLAAGVIWLSISFAAVLSLGRAWAREREGGALDGLLTTPLSPAALFAGKALGLWLFLCVIEAVVLPATALFFSLDLFEFGPGLCLVALLTTPGIAATGTLFGAMTVRTSARDLVLSIVLFPLLAPVLLTAVAATRGLLLGDPIRELGGFFRLIVVFDVTFWTVGLALFGTLVDD